MNQKLYQYWSNQNKKEKNKKKKPCGANSAKRKYLFRPSNVDVASFFVESIDIQNNILAHSIIKKWLERN